MPLVVSRVRALNRMSRHCSEQCSEQLSRKDMSISALPEAVLVYNVFTCLEPGDLCNVLAVSKRLKALQEAHDSLLWGKIVSERWNGSIVADAVSLAGSYRAYAQQKHASCQQTLVGGWLGPSEFELQASLMRISAALDGAESSSIIFLLDGSGSVGDEEFDASTSFIVRATNTAKAHSHHECKVTVCQFSSDVRTEWDDSAPSDQPDAPVFDAAIKSMVRMNGGTNIAAAVTHAGKALKKTASAEVAKVIVLITDGRVDGHQAKEARQVAAMLTDEQPNTTIFAYGVGRGIDRMELLNIVATAPPSHGCKYQDPESRYLDLFYREEAPW